MEDSEQAYSVTHSGFVGNDNMESSSVPMGKGWSLSQGVIAARIRGVK